MIRRLKIKFVCVNMAIVVVMLGAIFAALLFSTQRSLEREGVEFLRQAAASPLQMLSPGEQQQLAQSPYFFLDVTPEGEILAVGSNSYDLEYRGALLPILTMARRSADQVGVLEDYNLRFYQVRTPTSHRILFADISSERHAMESLTRGCLAAGAASLVVFFLISLGLAQWAVRPVESYEVSALASGEILEAPFEVGDWIEKGDLLYQLDAGDAQTSLQQAQLSLRQAKMSYDELAGYLTPRASATGVVQQVHVQQGDLVSPGTAIADITDTSTLKVTLPFQSADAAGIAPSQSAQVTIAGTLETLPGTVESVSSADLVGAGGALVRQVTIRVTNPGALTAGSSATATVGDIACAGSGTFEANSRQTVVAQTSGEVYSTIRYLKKIRTGLDAVIRGLEASMDEFRLGR